jgi:predicted permease
VSAANVANIIMARALGRRREIAVRSALGASRARLVTQVTIEAAVLSGLAAVIGVLAADAAIRWLVLTVKDMPFWVTLAVDWRVVAFVTGLSLLVSVVAGVGPALRVTRGSMFDALRESTTTLRFGRIAGGLIVSETAIAIALLSGTFVMVQSLSGFSVQDARLPLDRVLVAQLYFGQPPALAAADAPTDTEMRRRLWGEYLALVETQQRRLTTELGREAGVTAVSLASHFPGNEPMPATFFVRDGQGAERTAASRVVFGDAQYLDLLDTAPVSGRFFTPADVGQNLAVAVVNEPFVRRHFNGVNPIGALIKLDGDLPMRGPARDSGGWREIIGVIPDLAVNPGNPRYADAVYLPLEPDTVIRAAVRMPSHPIAAVPAIHRLAIGLQPRPMVQWTTTLDAQMAEPITALRALGAGLGALGGMALLLSCLGTYAIVAFSVAQRRREIAIRVAVGASPSNIVSAVLAPSATYLLIGTGAGTAIGIGLQQLLAQVPFALADGGIGGTFAMVALVAAAGALACAAPLRRALALRPGDWLKED